MNQLRSRILLPTPLLLLLALPTAVAAHHSFTAQFDANKPVTVRGTVTKMDWINPHSWIHLEAKDADGKTVTWMVELGTPNVLVRRGFTKKSLEAGTEIVVSGYQAKNGENKMNGGYVTFKDGTRLFAGGSGPGEAPTPIPGAPQK
jgi:Family of unknown function (DUF6152)